ncbi:hypothetical protein ABVV53_15560 [Novosphingobium sp. RD2P27]|uniref:O-antigen/teichoic acid export membrane protein n=1 Tax=Novosphingobium kalidii TaxID=3230299 RepID=A0ABV2D4R7_9SPHN
MARIKMLSSAAILTRIPTGWIDRGLNLVGPLGLAGSNFLLALVLVPAMSQADYGFFAFCVTLANFGYGITNATTATPLSIILNQGDDSGHASTYWALYKVNLLSSLVVGLAILSAGLAFGVGWRGAVVLALFGAVGALRWFRRAYEYATGRPRNSAWSDVTCSAVILLGTAIIFFSKTASLEAAGGVLLAAMISGTIILEANGRRTSFAFSEFWSYPISAYRTVWRDQSAWSLLGVLTTELTVNGHTYIVTFLAGPAAFAPIAVASLVWRPISTIFTSLMLAERPKMAKALAVGDEEGAKKILRQFQLIAFGVVGLNALIVLAAWIFMGDVWNTTSFQASYVNMAIVLYFVFVCIRSVRVPLSVFVQAGRQFRALAHTSLLAAPVTLLIAAILTVAVDPITSIAGIICGELVMTFGVWRLAKGIKSVQA